MSEGGSDRKTWVKASHTPSGTLVTVTVVEGAASAKWAVKAGAIPVGSIKRAVKKARAAAEALLDELQEAMVSD